MFIPEYTFWLSGRRYTLCSSFAARKVAGRVLGGWEAERVLSGAMRSSEMYALRKVCADVSDRMALHRMSNNEVLRALLNKLGVSRATGGELALIELAQGTEIQPRSANAAPADQSTELLAQALSRRLTREVIHTGYAYRILSRAAFSALEGNDSYELLSAEDARKVLAAMANDTQHAAELRGLLTQAATATSAAGARAPSPVVVLRRKRAFAQRDVESVPAQTPSQLRKAQATDWLEIAFLSDTGEPMANETYEVKLPNGATQRGTLDANGMAYLPGIVPGSCEVSFPDFVPKLAG